LNVVPYASTQGQKKAKPVEDLWVMTSMNSKVCRFLKDSIQSYLDRLRSQETKNEFLMWTESDVQSYIYSCLINDPNFKNKYAIINRPVLSSRDPKKKYKGKARNVKPLYQPDLLITPIENLKVERGDAPTSERRIGLYRKNQSVVVEIKFVQDTNESYGRKSVSKLKELADDYRKDKTEGHRNIILVFFERGKKSYLTKNDVQMRLNELEEFTVFHIPKESAFRQLRAH